MTPDVNQENQNAATTGAAVQASTDSDAQLKAAVTMADSISATARDKKNMAITLLTSSDEERAGVENFFRKVKLQADSTKKIYALSVEAARARNAGKPVPPSKQKKAKTDGK